MVRFSNMYVRKTILKPSVNLKTFFKLINFEEAKCLLMNKTFIMLNPVEINGLSINPDWCRISLKFTTLMVKMFDKIFTVSYTYSNILNGNRCLQGVNYNSNL